MDRGFEEKNDGAGEEAVPPGIAGQSTDAESKNQEQQGLMEPPVAGCSGEEVSAATPEFEGSPAQPLEPGESREVCRTVT